MRPDVDRARVRELLAARGRRGLTGTAELHEGFAAMVPQLFRFPGVDEARVEARLREIAGARPS